MHVIAVLVAVGVGVDPLIPIAGVPMLVRSARGVLASGVADRVLIHAGDHTDVLVLACAGLPVDAWHPRHASARIGAHAGQRAGGAVGDDQIILLVHDVARPLTAPTLFAAVVEAMREGDDAVVPVLPLPDTVKTVSDGGQVLGTPDRAGLRVVQTPYALRAAAWDVHCGLLEQPAALTARVVPGDPLAFAVRTAWDRELAELLAQT